MEILTEEEMAMRIDFRSPLQKEDPDAIPPRQSVYSIPFEYGNANKGTMVSVAKARQIVAELRAELAEWDKREIFRAFKQEQARSKEFADQVSKATRDLYDAKATIAHLERALRRAKRRSPAERMAQKRR